MAWLLLIVGGLFEVGFTTCLRFVDGFRSVPWTLGFLASVAVSMGLLEVASRTIPMGTAYAIWGGIGAAGTVIVGLWFFGEPATSVRLLLLVALIGCIIGLRLTAA
ncbi:MAG: quaternary ammonium compound-resistance protein SugE [Sphingomonadales bacterium]|jgi:quaternary ammonium compound-resistance protein SugE|nr:quaternary ammonium compound-resistance protein SugE [Sphingomonadales bacterium]MEA3048833.1 quaternary ammonium compound-resistance protein SugE [Sphingomonadales bacterium]